MGKYVTEAYLDLNDRNPDLFGDVILLRDDDGMGFGLGGLKPLRGKYVRVTVEEIPEPEGYSPHWLV